MTEDAARTMTFEGVRPVLSLPFGQDDAIRHRELAALTGRMVDAGVNGLVVLGLASESWALSDWERDEATATVAEAIAGRLPLVVGVEGATLVAVDRARRAVTAGAASLMVLPPSGAHTANQLVGHFGRLADSASVPILIQDSPQVTGVALATETLLALAAAHPLLHAVKVEVPGAGAKVSALVAAGMEIVAGWGGLSYLESLERGASGCMPGCDLGPAFLAIDRLARSGASEQAEALYRSILPLLAYEAQSLELLLLGAKRLLHRQGIFSSEALRAPARRLDALEAATIDRHIARLEREGVPGFVAARADGGAG